ncbi:4636_t:CDS:2 [Funneliformis geosporum]|nr:4636_t:CDS:2 [Funneliformis geosporum]
MADDNLGKNSNNNTDITTNLESTLNVALLLQLLTNPTVLYFHVIQYKILLLKKNGINGKKKKQPKEDWKDFLHLSYDTYWTYRRNLRDRLNATCEKGKYASEQTPGKIRNVINNNIIPPDPKHKKVTPNYELSSTAPNSESSTTPNSESSSSIILHKSISPIQNSGLSSTMKSEIQSLSLLQVPVQRKQKHLEIKENLQD